MDEYGIIGVSVFVAFAKYFGPSLAPLRLALFP